jgi:hypothetical protein
VHGVRTGRVNGVRRAGYEAPMGAVLVPIVLIVIVAVVAAVAVKRFSRAEVERSDRLQNADRPTLRYEVPPGQDPAHVVAGLRQAGYDVSKDSEPGPPSPMVIIGAKGGAPDREDVRRALADLEGTHMNPPESGKIHRSEIKFQDE